MTKQFDPTTLEIYRALYTSVDEEMGIALRRTAFSPNIKERRDYSCAVFDARGRVQTSKAGPGRKNSSLVSHTAPCKRHAVA